MNLSPIIGARCGTQLLCWSCGLVLIATCAASTVVAQDGPDARPNSPIEIPQEQVSQNEFFRVVLSGGVIRSLYCDARGTGSFGPNLLAAEGIALCKGHWPWQSTVVICRFRYRGHLLHKCNGSSPFYVPGSMMPMRTSAV